MNQGWRDKAACQETGLDFYELLEVKRGQVNRKQLDRLVLTCHSCPVARECATFAMRDGAVEEYGVWAGSLPAQRMALAGGGAKAVKLILGDLEFNAGKALARLEKGAA